jgi:glucose/arabinose dehydrogenase
VYAYVSTATDNRVVRFTYDGRRLGAVDPVLTGIPNGFIHDGGRLLFADDGTLLVSTGETGKPPLAQDPASLAGKVLRITVDGGPAPGNPDPGSPVWTLGHRNVQGLAWDRKGRMFASEFGQGDRDELNRIVKGHNYGWPVVEGGDGPGGRFHDPYVSWAPTAICSPSGLAVARDRAWVAALRGRSLYAVNLFGPRVKRKTRYFHDRLGRIRTVERAPDGSLWVMTSNRDGRGTPRSGDDKIVRIVLG